MTLSRRQLIRSAAATAAVGALGGVDSAVRHVAHAGSASERKFLFFFASGGWDPTPLDPKYAADGISPGDATDMDPDTWLGRAGNLTFSDGDDRRGMGRYFERWGHRTALVRGVNVHSAGHEAGMQWMLTGTSASSMSDWPTLLSHHGSGDYPMPHLVFSGPTYSGPLGAAVVRGGGGTLLDLIDGDVLAAADRPSPQPPTPADSIVDAFVHGRAARFASARQGLGRRRADSLTTNLERAMELEGRAFEAGLNDTGSSVLDQALMAVEVMRLGLSRCAMIGIPGSWDTHGGNRETGAQLGGFFDALDELFAHMAATPGLAAPWLIDEVTVVCCSELGRTPRFNGSMGRDHWPYTSMMVAGSGVRGNAVVGATDDGFIAEPVDLETGLPSSSGTVIGCEHVGAALLELGGLDSAVHRPDVQPLSALLA
jgi:hypothetical protein